MLYINYAYIKYFKTSNCDNIFDKLINCDKIKPYDKEGFKDYISRRLYLFKL